MRAINANSHLLLVCMAAIAAILAASGAANSGIDLFTIDGQPVVLTASEQNREEVWNYFNPGSVKGGFNENQYNFLGSWLRLGAGYQLDGIKGYAELMVPYLVNLPDKAIAPSPKGLLGLGANYYQPYGNANDASVFLKQGYLEFGRELLGGFELKGGRFEFFDGVEFEPDDLDSELKWLLDNRIKQRLIGNFGFSDVMRSFDGALATYGDDRWQASVMYGVPTKGVFDINGMNEISDMDLAYASLNAGPKMFTSPAWGNSLFRLFYIYYSDTRGLPLVDNRELKGSSADTGPVSIDTVGADYVRTLQAGPGVIDLLGWCAGQFGSWGTLSQRAYAVVGEAGYRLDNIAWKPWIRIGYTVGSGDGNPKDSTHGTFFQILPTPRQYAFFPFFNMMNVDDAMLQLILEPHSGMEIQSSIHGLWLDSKEDLWYSGGGAYDNRFFGYSGRPSNGSDYLATLADCQFTWRMNEHVTLQLYYGHAFGGSVIGSNFPSGREADYGFIQTTFKL